MMRRLEELTNQLVLEEGMEMRVSGTLTYGVDVDETLENYLGVNNISFLRNEYVINHLRDEEGTPLVNSGEITRIAYMVQDEIIYAVPVFAYDNGIGLVEVMNFDKKKKVMENPIHVKAEDIDFRSLIKAAEELKEVNTAASKTAVSFINSFIEKARAQGVNIEEYIPESSVPEDFNKALFDTIKILASFYKQARSLIGEENYLEKIIKLSNKVNLYAYPGMHDFTVSIICTMLKEFENIESYNNEGLVKTVLNDCYVISKQKKENGFNEYLEAQEFSCEIEKEITTNLVKSFISLGIK